MTVTIGNRSVGVGHPCFVVAEVGINHNSSVDLALQTIDAAAEAGADAVKFQVGDPRKYVNPSTWDVPRETPWGVVPYIEYRERMELSDDELRVTADYANLLGMQWFASPLDTSAIPRLEALGVPCYKVASPMLTDLRLLNAIANTGKPIIMSTGMSTAEEIRTAVVRNSGRSEIVLLHCTSAYPCPPEQCNLRMLDTLRERFPSIPVGYSGHEIGVPQTVAAVAMGACVVERHITTGRSLWGSDHAASLEPDGFKKLVKYIRTVEASMGTGEKRVYDSEQANKSKFRRDAA